MLGSIKQFVQKHIFISTAVVMAVPLAVLIAYTLLTLNDGRADKKTPAAITPVQSQSELIDAGIELLRKNDYDNFALKVKGLKNANAVNQKGQTLMDASVFFNNMDAAQLLYSMGADVNLPNPNTGETPVMTALRAGNDSMTEFLIAAGANLNAVSNNGATPLLIAVANKNMVWIDRLISRGSTAGASGQNLLAFVTEKNMPGIIAMLKSGISPNIKNAAGYTPLYMAASMGDLDMARWIQGYKADLETAASDGSTPLIASARYRKPDVLAFLLDKGANVNARNNKGETALYWTAVNNMVQSADQLLLLKADATVRTNSGLTPFQVAQQKHFVDMLAVFKKYNITQ